jgi:hypothetical protein
VRAPPLPVHFGPLSGDPSPRSTCSLPSSTS